MRFKLSPTEALDQLKAFCFFSSRRLGGPGAVVLGAKENVREALKRLKSDDLKNIRPDAIFGSD